MPEFVIFTRVKTAFFQEPIIRGFVHITLHKITNIFIIDKPTGRSATDEWVLA